MWPEVSCVVAFVARLWKGLVVGCMHVGLGRGRWSIPPVLTQLGSNIVENHDVQHRGHV